MKFSDFKYKRPDMDAIEGEFTKLLQVFEKADSADSQNKAMAVINKLRNEFDSMMNIAYIRYSTDTNNKDFEAEQQFFDKNYPLYTGIVNRFYKALISSEFRADLEAVWGKQLFQIAEMTIETFNESIISDLQEENRLGSEYTKLIASAKIDFEGEVRNTSGMIPFERSSDREMRQKASKAKWGFYSENSEKIDTIFAELVKVRNGIAKKLGYGNFVELGYKRMLRTDYNAEMVAGYRKQVLDVIVPIAADLRKRQGKRLGISEMKYFDLGFNFKSGNPTPKGNPDWIVGNGKKMYEELSSETGEFFNFMLENDLMDLVTRKGKATGGYCTYVAGYDSPFIFSNFNGTSDDINVLTHEAGHAFQVYMSRQWEVPEYQWPTYEACEIHSMSMEFFAWPWMESFFKDETDKFKFEHLSGSILFLPYGVAVDEFQHFVYENPDISPAERNEAWRKIEQKYMPWVDYDDNDYLENGSYWQKQSHIFNSPFYYIDYTLAQICAFQFWKKHSDNPELALEDYIRLCKAGGSKSFLKLVEYANLTSPFKEGCLEEVVKPVESFLESVDDQVFA